MRAALRFGLCVLAILFAPRANAATISVTRFPSGETLVAIDGRFEHSDLESFRQKTSDLPKAIVAFQSDGGFIDAALGIGKIIRERNYWTLVSERTVCASACALAWLGGTQRFMASTALIGFHAAYNAQTGQETGMANALVGSYLGKIGLPDEAVMYITERSPSSMNFLTPSDAKRYGIDVALLDGHTERESPTTAPTPAVPNYSMRLQERAQGFLAGLYGAVNGASTAAVLTAYYADTVTYYGKALPRGEVLSQIQRFIERWPFRSYSPKFGAVKIDCDDPSLTCRASGVVQFDAQSTVRNERSTGEATFEYRLAFSSAEQGAPKITAEGGSVLSRDIVSLNTGPNGWVGDLLNKLKGGRSFSQSAPDRHATH